MKNTVRKSRPKTRPKEIKYMHIAGAWLGTETDPPLLHKKGETITINLIPYKVKRRSFKGETLVLYMEGVSRK